MSDGTERFSDDLNSFTSRCCNATIAGSSLQRATGHAGEPESERRAMGASCIQAGGRTSCSSSRTGCLFCRLRRGKRAGDRRIRMAFMAADSKSQRMDVGSTLQFISSHLSTTARSLINPERDIAGTCLASLVWPTT